VKEVRDDDIVGAFVRIDIAPGIGRFDFQARMMAQLARNGFEIR